MPLEEQMKYLLSCLSFLLVVGCASKPATQITAGDDNLFYCSYPKVKIQIDPDFKYFSHISGEKRFVGKTNYHDPAHMASYDYFFGKVDEKNKRIKELVTVTILKTFYSWDYNISFKNSDRLFQDKGKYQLGKKKYRYVTEIVGFNGRLEDSDYLLDLDIGIQFMRITGHRWNLMILINYQKDLEGINLNKDNWREYETNVQKEFDKMLNSDSLPFKVL